MRNAKPSGVSARAHNSVISQYDRLYAVSHGKGENAPHGALLCRRRAMGSNDLPPYAPPPRKANRRPAPAALRALAARPCATRLTGRPVPGRRRPGHRPRRTGGSRRRRLPAAADWAARLPGGCVGSAEGGRRAARLGVDGAGLRRRPRGPPPAGRRGVGPRASAAAGRAAPPAGPAPPAGSRAAARRPRRRLGRRAVRVPSPYAPSRRRRRRARPASPRRARTPALPVPCRRGAARRLRARASLTLVQPASAAATAATRHRGAGDPRRGRHRDACPPARASGRARSPRGRRGGAGARRRRCAERRTAGEDGRTDRRGRTGTDGNGATAGTLGRTGGAPPDPERRDSGHGRPAQLPPPHRSDHAAGRGRRDRAQP